MINIIRTNHSYQLVETYDNGKSYLYGTYPDLRNAINDGVNRFNSIYYKGEEIQHKYLILRKRKDKINKIKNRICQEKTHINLRMVIK
jgi:hypothetical protein